VQLMKLLCLALAIVTLAPNVRAGTWTEKPLLVFNGNGAGGVPTEGLIFDSAGSLYGATSEGGDLNCLPGTGCGVVFKLTPDSNGGWQESVLHEFKGGTDGSVPGDYTSLAFDGDGNLYGTTSTGGGSKVCDNGISGCGTVYELTPTASGPWKETILYRFAGGTGGYGPEGGLVIDQQGNLYGTTGMGGGSKHCGELGCGIIFELTPGVDGAWTIHPLHAFNGSPNGCGNCDGGYPEGPLVLDAAGNLYGATSGGGNNNNGTVYELMPLAGGGWKYEVIYRFSGSTTEGANPYGGVIVDGQGNLYGTALTGGGWTSCNDTPGCGAVFELSPNSGGWTQTLLYSFMGGTDGQNPAFPLASDAAGNLYGSTEGSEPIDCPPSCGTVFKLSPSGSGSWTETVLVSFDETDGFLSQGLILDSKGDIYGALAFGGNVPLCDGYGCGLIFELTQ
jgi:uncharacterized repeat protein (TIGR03803 family)